MSISVVVIAKNAEDTILRNLKSVQFADEVILFDIKSTDKTTQLAQKYCSKIYNYKEDSRFVEPIRNFSLEQASKDWILVLDSDEEIPLPLANKLLEIDQNDSGDVYYLARKNMISGAWMQHTGCWPDYQLRFFRNGLVSWPKEIHSQPIIKNNLKPLFLAAKEDLAILHYNYENTQAYLERFNRYTDIEAEQQLAKEGDSFSISSSSLLKKFSDDWLRRFFAKDGHQDGVRGFYLSTMQAAYQMTVQMKMFDLLKNQTKFEKNDQQTLVKDLRHFQKELNYWINDLEIKENNGLKRFYAILKRKFNL
jgi:glycosyltransferase involved in cell wall biosynthesis